MSFNGNGVYTPPSPAFPAISGEIIFATDFNDIISDIAAALSLCVTTDGQSGVTADISLGTHKLTNVAPGTAAADAVNMLQAFTNPVFTTTTAQGLTITGTGVTIMTTNTDLTLTNVTVATQAALNSTAKVANTAFVTAADAVVTAAFQAADTLKAPLASPAFTGIPTAPTAAPGTNTNQLATMAAVVQQAFSTALPVQAGEAGKFLQTNGVMASWQSSGDIIRIPLAGAYVVLPADRMALIDATAGTWALGFSAANLLKNGWACYARNSGTGGITLVPNGAETIDGLASLVMWPGECRLIQCDGTSLRSIVINAFKKTWTTTDATPVVPPGYAALGYRLASGSGGGGSGRRGLDSNIAYGGVGGGGAGYYEGVFASPTVGGSFVVTIGAAGVGGAARTTDGTNGQAGTNGGSSSIVGAGLGITVGGGVGGAGGVGTGSPSAAAGGGFGSAFRTAGTNSVANGAGDYGGGSSGGVIGNGTLGGSINSLFGAGGGGGGCGYNGGVPTVAAAFGASTYGNAGGAGGAAATAGSTGGSTAGKPGGGGGGGGASINGTNSGAGGNGVAGFVTIWGIV